MACADGGVDPLEEVRSEWGWAWFLCVAIDMFVHGMFCAWHGWALEVVMRAPRLCTSPRATAHHSKLARSSLRCTDLSRPKGGQGGASGGSTVAEDVDGDEEEVCVCVGWVS